MQLFHRKFIIRLLTLSIVIMLTLGCFAGCFSSPSANTTAPSNGIDSSTHNSTSNRGEGNTDDSATEPPTSLKPATPSPDEIVIYAQVPDSWGVPDCWVWLTEKDTINTVYDTWPGESMLYDGKYYYATVPKWVNQVIISCNNGTTLTEDITIDAGQNVWIYVLSNGKNYFVSYSEYDDVIEYSD